MQRCDVCGNEYDKCFNISLNNKDYVFDSFECAIHALAPVCTHCQCKIVGHGVEDNNNFYCCAHCAKLSGVSSARDRA